MQEQLTAVFEKTADGYIGYVKELPGANTQGATLDETRENLLEAIQLVIVSNRILADENNSKVESIDEPMGMISI